MNWDNLLETPRLPSSSLASKHPSSEKVLPVRQDKKKQDRQKDNSLCFTTLMSHDVNSSSLPTDCLARDNQFDHLSMVISDLIAKLDGNQAASASDRSCTNYSGFTAISCEDEDDKIPVGAADPLNEHDSFGDPQLAHPEARSDNADFLHALEELSGHFHSEEEMGELLSACLATILDASLRYRPSSDAVKSTCGKIKLSSNVPNLTVPMTNSAITTAKSVGGKFINLCFISMDYSPRPKSL
ncbi:hypothetical protein E2C01_059818 [Portunus trituberculatus]|uniref:Uncharacterized protein n=1 Tax=Portunus trituberculatus TaxID=210409 RepID=A0A5B7H0K7_PORTR|nr:hypothetical protein [Portunus trituberculatus]